MSTLHALPLLDLTARQSARDREFRPGSSVWYREDVRLADGAAKVVPAVFVEYDRRRRTCAISRGHDPNLSTTRRPSWVSLDDVFPRHWGDGVEDDRPRLAWVAGPLPAPPERSGDLFVVVAFALFVLVVLVAVWLVWRS